LLDVVTKKLFLVRRNSNVIQCYHNRPCILVDDIDSTDDSCPLDLVFLFETHLIEPQPFALVLFLDDSLE
jgi:hypothetical protein